jgi:trehalose 6-phosphate synthase
VTGGRSSASVAFASNRGPISFRREVDGSLSERRGVGGLVTAVGGALRAEEAAWVAAAISDADREAARANEGRLEVALGRSRVRVRLLDADPGLFDLYYNGFANRILWYLHHYLFDPPRTPAFGPAETEAWDAFQHVNRLFAETIAEETAENGIVLPQDFHLSLVPVALRKTRPDVRVAHFWHIPFCQPDAFRFLPQAWGRALLEGLLSADLIGFHTQRWATSFIECCTALLGARYSRRRIQWAGGTTRIGVYPVGPDPKQLGDALGDPQVAVEQRALEEMAGDRIVILRVDRTEMSKNILRGLGAYELTLERRPDLRERVVHIVLLSPSRRAIPEYNEYVAACVERADRINERFGTRDWTPVELTVRDNYASTLAAYRRYDVLVVNPIFDGMNLVCREGPIVNEREGVLVLSSNAGAAAELAPAALMVNPFDIEETAAAITAAVEIPAAERRERARRLRSLAAGRSPARWLRAQLKDLTSARGV